MTEASAIAVIGLTKRFGSTVALDDCSFTASAGEVHALLGENGAGKSTLVKALAGIARPDAGEVRLFGVAARIETPRAAHRLGIQTAFQEISLVKDLTVAQNMLMPYEPARWLGQVQRRRAEERVRQIFAEVGLEDVDPRAEIATLDLSVRQRIEIARAVARDPRLLLLDEPTSALSGRDVDWLGALISA